jgi:hypothetical protein
MAGPFRSAAVKADSGTSKSPAPLSNDCTAIRRPASRAPTAERRPGPAAIRNRSRAVPAKFKAGFRDLAFSASGVAWVAYGPVSMFPADFGKLYVTHDGGQHWQLVTP